MKYRLAGGTYRVIAEKLTEERAQAYADEKGISIDRAMRKIQPVSVKTAWDDVMAEMEDLRRETELQRADLMALENARLDQLFSKALSMYGKGSVPAGRLALLIMGRRAKLNGIDAPTKIAPTDPTGERPADTGAGSIPARAGETRTSTGRITAIAVHPRACGAPCAAPAAARLPSARQRSARAPDRDPRHERHRCQRRVTRRHRRAAILRRVMAGAPAPPGVIGRRCAIRAVRRLGGDRAVMRLRAMRLATRCGAWSSCARINRRTRSCEVRIPSTRSFAQTFR